MWIRGEEQLGEDREEDRAPADVLNVGIADGEKISWYKARIYSTCSSRAFKYS